MERSWRCVKVKRARRTTLEVHALEMHGQKTGEEVVLVLGVAIVVWFGTVRFLLGVARRITTVYTNTRLY